MNGPILAPTEGMKIFVNLLLVVSLFLSAPLQASQSETHVQNKASVTEQMQIDFQAHKNHWSTEVFEAQDEDSVYVHDFLARLQNWVLGFAPMTEDDQTLQFVATQNNKLEVYKGYDVYQNKLFADLENAKESIHIQMFGWHADEYDADKYNYDMAQTLIKKSKHGVKVRILMDKFWVLLSNITPSFSKKTKPMTAVVQALRDAGVEVIISDRHDFKKLDHRKNYVIDGKIAWNTGYTINQGTRIQGDLTYQYQSLFLISWSFLGGKFPEAKNKTMNLFWKKYYSPLNETGNIEAKLLSNDDYFANFN